MKTIKFILPMLAFLFAIVASFATVSAKSTVLYKRVSLMTTPSTCSDIGKCNVEEDDEICTHPTSGQVKEIFSGGTCAFTALHGVWAGTE